MKHEADLEGEPVDMGPAQSSDAGVDLDGMRARPMAEASSRPKGKKDQRGWFERMRGSISADYGFQQTRKKASTAPKRPDYGFLEIFYRHAADKNGQERKLTIKERFLRGYQMGQWFADRALGKAVSAGQRLLRRGKYAPEPFDPLREGELGTDAEEASSRLEEQMARKQAQAEEKETSTEEKQDFWKREEEPRGTGSSASSDRVNIYPTQHDTSRQMGSERVGPERQVERNDGPWPLDRPSSKEMPDRKALPSPSSAKTKESSEPSQTDVKSKGEAASERGREAARDLHARKSEEKSVRPAAKKDRGAER